MLTDLAHANFWWTALRNFWATFDKIIYSVMGFVYEVFLNVASQNILGGTVTKALIGRMQLIIGIIFLFILAVNIVQGIVNPDNFTDKDNGTSKLIIRIIVSLMLIACMIPLNIPNASRDDSELISTNSSYTWEDALSEQGILFGTLTFFQNKVLESNVLGKLILGSNAPTYSEMNNGNGTEGNNGLSEAGNYMTSGILRMFIRPNQQSEEFLDGATVSNETGEGFVCSDTEDFFKDDGTGRLNYYNEEYETNYLFGYIDNTCTLDDDHAKTNLGDTSMAGDYYQFAYMGGYSTAVGIFVVIVLISFTIELAIRVFKLVILRILGPIAAVSYVLPSSSSSSGMFSSWVKQLFSTYIDVFLRVAIIYFCILVVSGLLSSTTEGIYNVSTGVGFTTMIFLIVGLFMFAKQAPKFIRQMFGMPDSDKGMFSGLGSLLGFGLGAAGVAGGMVSRAIGNVNASRQRAEADENRDPNSKGSIARQVGAGALGLLTGGVVGGIGAVKADSNSKRFSNALDNVRQGNLLNMQRARAQSTAWGRTKDRVATFLGGGESPLERDERMIANLEAEAATGEDLYKYMQDRALKMGGKVAYDMKYNGKNLSGVTLSDFRNVRQAAINHGDSEFKFKGEKFKTNDALTDDFEDQLYDKALSTVERAQETLHALGHDYDPAWQSLLDKRQSFVNSGGDKANLDSVKKVRTASKVATAGVNKIKNSKEYQDHKVNYQNK